MRGRKRSEGHFLADSFISEGAEGSEKGWMRLSHSGSPCTACDWCTESLLEAWQQPRVADQGNCVFYINTARVIATCWDYQVQKLFFSSWSVLCCHGSTGHEIGGRAFSGMSKRDLRLFVYCLRALTHPARYLMLLHIARLSFSD